MALAQVLSVMKLQAKLLMNQQKHLSSNSHKIKKRKIAAFGFDEQSEDEELKGIIESMHANENSNFILKDD